MGARGGRLTLKELLLVELRQQVAAVEREEAAIGGYRSR
jgi:hypothetical protein